jgi:hypothetical protein
MPYRSSAGTPRSSRVTTRGRGYRAQSFGVHERATIAPPLAEALRTAVQQQSRRRKRCDQAGTLHRDDLVARFGRRRLCLTVLIDRGSCDRRRDFTRPRSAGVTELGRPSVGFRPSVG